MSIVTGIDHFTIHSSLEEETIAFFTDILGLENRPEDRPAINVPGAWLWAGDQALVHLVWSDDRNSSQPAPLDHVALATNDMDGLIGRLDAAGIEYRFLGNEHLSFRQVFFKDPNGVKLEVTSRDF